MKILPRQAPVARPQLMDIYGRLPVLAGNRVRLPVPPYSPERLSGDVLRHALAAVRATALV